MLELALHQPGAPRGAGGVTHCGGAVGFGRGLFESQPDAGELDFTGFDGLALLFPRVQESLGGAELALQGVERLRARFG